MTTQFVRFHHPLYDRNIEIDIETDMNFFDISNLLYKKEFVEKKRGGYQYLINDNLCVMNLPISSYIPVPAPQCLDVQVHALLTILI